MTLSHIIERSPRSIRHARSVEMAFSASWELPVEDRLGYGIFVVPVSMNRLF